MHASHDPADLQDVVDLFERSAEAFRTVLVEVTPDHHHLATPCAPFDVAGLVAKAIGHQDWVRRAIDGEDDPPAYPPVDPEQWTAAFDRSTAAMVATLRADGALDREVPLAAGSTYPGRDVAILAARNVFQFGWDLAVATGQDPDLAPDVAADLLAVSRTRLVPQRGPNGFFGPEFVPAAGAPTATVLAGFLGREVT